MSGFFRGLPTGRLGVSGSGNGLTLGLPTGRLGISGSGSGLVLGLPTGRFGASGSGSGLIRGLPTGRFDLLGETFFSVCTGSSGFPGSTHLGTAPISVDDSGTGLFSLMLFPVFASCFGLRPLF